MRFLLQIAHRLLLEADKHSLMWNESGITNSEGAFGLEFHSEIIGNVRFLF